MPKFSYHPIFGFSVEEEASARDERARKLIDSIEKAIKHHSQALEIILASANELSDGIARGFAISDQRSSGYLWGKRSVLDVFRRVFDPVLHEIFPENSMGWTELLLAGIPLPIDQHLNSSECRDVADRFKAAAKGLEDRIKDLPSMGRQLISHGETLEFLASILYLINQQMPENEIRWCEICYRRAPSSSRYCDEHRPHAGGSDGVYRKGRRLKEKNRAFAERWNKYRAIRQALEEHPKLISKRSHLPDDVASNFVGMRVRQAIVDVVEITLSQPWEVVGRDLGAMIKSVCPNVHDSLMKPVGEYDSWPSFVKGLRVSLRNTYEEITHPYWVLFEIVMAEEWIAFVSKNADGRVTGKKEQILKLHEQGASVKEITERVGVQSSYAYKIIKTSS